MVVEGKVDEAREEVDKVDEVDKVGEAGEKEKERRVIIEIIQDANDILIAEESEEEDFKCEDCGDSENADP